MYKKFIANYFATFKLTAVNQQFLNSEYQSKMIKIEVLLLVRRPGSLLDGRAEIPKIFGLHFERNDDLINSFLI